MSDPVVEELLEKGARALAERGSERLGSDLVASLVPTYREMIEISLDAVFPGWREGITREWGYTADGEGAEGFIYGASDEKDAQKYAGVAEGSPVSRLTWWVGPWVPVEEGTDG